MASLYARFTGRVQGVGFRGKTRALAKELNLVGHVENLADGSVELTMHGEKQILETFMSRLTSHFQNEITHIDLKYQ